MGLFTHALAFGAGYATGMKVGSRPVDVARSAVEQGRERLSTATARAGDVRAALQGVGGTVRSSITSGRSVDVRTVGEAMSGSPETVSVTSTVKRAAELMQSADIGSVVVVDDSGHVRGIVTDRDVTLRVIAAGLDPASTRVEGIMTPSPTTIEPTSTVQEAMTVMKQQDVRRLPVVESGRPVGVIALADVVTSPQARALLEEITTAPPNN